MKTYTWEIHGEQVRVLTSDGDIYVVKVQEFGALRTKLAEMGYAEKLETEKCYGYRSLAKRSTYPKGCSMKRENSKVFKHCK
jgi:hypothetical protein